MDDVRQRLAANLRKLRQDKGLSQEAFADEAGLHRTYVSDIERGARNPTITVVEKLAHALGGFEVLVPAGYVRTAYDPVFVLSDDRTQYLPTESDVATEPDSFRSWSARLKRSSMAPPVAEISVPRGRRPQTPSNGGETRAARVRAIRLDAAAKYPSVAGGESPAHGWCAGGRPAFTGVGNW